MSPGVSSSRLKFNDLLSYTLEHIGMVPCCSLEAQHSMSGTHLGCTVFALLIEVGIEWHEPAT
jgi:hypothetical protein